MERTNATRLVVSAVFVAVAVVAFILGRYTGQPPMVGPRGPTVVGASIDVECSNGKTYTITTGNNRGKCKRVSDGGVCTDAHGNDATTSCVSGCVETSGSGDCKKKA
jgi:hypothetical protein